MLIAQARLMGNTNIVPFEEISAAEDMSRIQIAPHVISPRNLLTPKGRHERYIIIILLFYFLFLFIYLLTNVFVFCYLFLFYLTKMLLPGSQSTNRSTNRRKRKNCCPSSTCPTTKRSFSVLARQPLAFFLLPPLIGHALGYGCTATEYNCVLKRKLTTGPGRLLIFRSHFCFLPAVGSSYVTSPSPQPPLQSPPPKQL